MAQWQDKARVNSYLYTTTAVHYELLHFCRKVKEITLLSSHGYKEQEEFKSQKITQGG